MKPVSLPKSCVKVNIVRCNRDYRLLNDYWRKRLVNREYDRLIITRGYPRSDDSDRRIDVPYQGYKVQSIIHKHFGPDPVNVFAIKVNIHAQ
ncbi:ASCH domain-containing protein [Salmonella enterica subsp. enterica serovar Heidelberg]|nr:ASCH domain-containing protein [Salmonella enterica subsp. enterica serovar Heidelberg]